MTDPPRNQHIIASGFVAAVGVWVAYVSYTQEPAAAFLFAPVLAGFIGLRRKLVKAS